MSEDAQPDQSTISRVIFAVLFLLSLLALLSSLAPPTAKDTLLYHFSLPKAYIAAGGHIEVPYNIAGYLPLGAEMHSVWAMLTGSLIDVRVGEAAAGATQFAFYPLLLAAIYSWAKEHVVDIRWAAAAALMVGAAPTVYYVAANAYVDVATRVIHHARHPRSCSMVGAARQMVARGAFTSPGLRSLHQADRRVSRAAINHSRSA
ncbi:MAG: hypothetical protein WKF84_13675 [Pyrinomonadaceae bacterium]